MAHENYNHWLISNPPRLIYSGKKNYYKINMSHGNGFYHFNYCIALLNELVFPSRFFSGSFGGVCACLALHIHNRSITDTVRMDCEPLSYGRICTFDCFAPRKVCGVAMNMNDKHQKINGVLTKQSTKNRAVNSLRFPWKCCTCAHCSLFMNEMSWAILTGISNRLIQ